MDQGIQSAVTFLFLNQISKTLYHINRLRMRQNYLLSSFARLSWKRYRGCFGIMGSFSKTCKITVLSCTHTIWKPRHASKKTQPHVQSWMCVCVCTRNKWTPLRCIIIRWVLHYAIGLLCQMEWTGNKIQFIFSSMDFSHTRGNVG